MPIDPSIILHTNTTPFDLMKSLAQGRQLQQQQRAQDDEHGLRVQQLANEQLQNQSGQLQLQAAQQADADDKAFRQIMGQTGGNLEQAIPLIAQHAPKLALSLNKQMEDYKESQVKRKTGEIELESKKQGLAGEAFNRIWTAPPPLRPQLYGQERQGAIQSGLVKPEQLPEQYPGDEWLAAHRFMGLATDKVNAGILAERKDKRDEAKSNDESLAAAQGREEYAIKKPALESSSEKTIVANAAAQLAAIADDKQREATIGMMRPELAARFKGRSRDEILQMGQTANEIATGERATSNAEDTAADRTQRQSNEDRNYGLAKERLGILKGAMLPDSGTPVTPEQHMKSLEDAIPQAPTGAKVTDEVLMKIVAAVGNDPEKIRALAKKKGYIY